MSGAITASPIQRVARASARALLDRLRDGRLEVEEDGDVRTFGDRGAEPAARVRIRRPRAWNRLLHGSAGLGASYADGDWDVDDLVALARIGARAMHRLDPVRRRWHPVLGRAQRLAHLVPRNSRRGARANVAAHYDLGNELFAAFLDERLLYSCAYFAAPGVSLEQAQLAKLDRLCARLELGPDDHLLEIGAGWGGMAIHAASEYGCRVTTTTISREQHAYASARVRELGLGDRIAVLDRDYRDLEGEYSKLVSIEMIEAVGWQYFPTFFRKCSSLLRRDGLMALQAIVIVDEAYEIEKASKSFANTHIFPGGCLPSEQVIGGLISTQTDLRPAWTEEITAHYAETLRLWRERFNAAIPRLEPRGYDRRFQRLWNFYLAFSEGGFREGRIRDLQMLFAKPGRRGRRSAAGRAEPALT